VAVRQAFRAWTVESRTAKVKLRKEVVLCGRCRELLLCAIDWRRFNMSAKWIRIVVAALTIVASLCWGVTQVSADSEFGCHYTIHEVSQPEVVCFSSAAAAKEYLASGMVGYSLSLFEHWDETGDFAYFWFPEPKCNWWWEDVVNLSSYLVNRVSSYTTWDCPGVTLYQGTGLTGTSQYYCCYTEGYVGATMNDKVRSIHMIP
jgi:hypothetical protein